MRSRNRVELCNVCCLASCSDGSKYILVINQALVDYDSQQYESLLQPHQVRDNGIVIDDIAKRHRVDYDGNYGTQSIHLHDESRIPLNYDGFKVYLQISKPSDDDMVRFPHVTLTSDSTYTPQTRKYSRRVEPKKLTLKDWQARLGYCTEEVTRKTLEGTTRLVPTVEAETRDYPRGHKKTRLPMLRPFRINDTATLDIFHSTLPSVRGYRKFLMCSLVFSKLDDVHLMRAENQTVGCWLDFIRRIGAPNTVITDCAKIFQGKDFLSSLRLNVIDNHYSEPHEQNGNPAERSGGAFKTDLLLLFNKTPWAPLNYWCYATEWLNVVRKYRCRKSLHWRPPLQIVNGETLDISLLRFYWFQPVFFYDKDKSFPTNKLIPGFFLGFDITVGDGFCFKILVAKDIKDIPRSRPKVLTRSVVRARDLSMKEDDFPTAVQTAEGLVIKDSKGDVLEGELDKDIELLPGSEEPFSEELDSEEPSSSPINFDLLEDNTDDSIPDDQLLDLSFDTSAQLEDDVLPPIPEEEDEEEDITIDECAVNPLATAPITFEPASDSTPAYGNPHVISQDDDNDMSDDCDYYSDDDFIVPNPKEMDRKCVEQVNTVLNEEYDLENEDDEFEISNISDFRFIDGQLELKCHYFGGEYDWVPWKMACDDCPKTVSDYIQDTDFKNKIVNGYTNRWSRRFERNLNKTIRRMFKVDFESHYRTVELSEYWYQRSLGNVSVRHAKIAGGKRVPHKKRKTKPGRNKRHLFEKVFKYGHEVPKTYADCLRIDEANGNTAWQDSIAKEVGALVHHGCFDFKSPNYKPPREYQKAFLHWVYDIKSCGRFKSRLVCQGHRVDPRGLSTRATVVKTLSARALDVIAAANGLKTIIGDIGNAFIQAKTKEKCYITCGPEFGEHFGCVALIVKALYGLRTSAERFHSLLSDFLRGLGFRPTKFDRDVWIRRRDGKDVKEDGYDYICTHVDDFKIVAENPEHWLQLIKEHFLVKEAGPLKYYLGNDFSFCDKGNLWTFGSVTYAKESIKKVESLFGPLKKSKTPLPVSKDCHPEIDESPLLKEKDHRRYQMLLGMLQWLNTIGRPDLCHACCSLSRFGSCPRETHLELAVHCFQYLKQFPDRKIAIDPNPLNYERVTPDWLKLVPDFLRDYPDAKEEDDPNFPSPLGKALDSTILVDADHGHDKKTGRSLTGLILYLGSTPVLWISKRQGAIACSTYHAEFSALRTAAEKAVTIRYLLRSFGVPVKGATNVFGDNFAVIQNAQNPEADLDKKHVALSFHYVRECIAAGVLRPYWLKGKLNMSDIMTKQIVSTEFNAHCDSLFYRPDFHIRKQNNLSEELSIPVRRLLKSCLAPKKKVTFAKGVIFNDRKHRRRR